MPAKARRRTVSSDKRLRRNRPHATAHRADHGTNERWQHSGKTFETTETAGVLAARATEEHTVDILLLRGIITSSQRDAALKLKLDFHRAALAARTIGGYNAAHTSRDFFRTERERTDWEDAAYQRWRNAARELGMQYSAAVISVICQDLAPLPRDLPLLQKGLEKLVKWYGLPE